MLLVLGLGALLAAGCASDKQSGTPGVLAAVEIHQQTPSQIADAAIAVFRRHDYQAARHGKRELIFDKPASKGARFLYGGWTEASTVWERVTVAIEPAGEMAWRLECNGYLVADRGDPTEERIKHGHLKPEPLQAILEEIAARLRTPPGETSAP